MATAPQPTPGQIPGFNSQIDSLQQQADTYQSNLTGSSTAFGEATPSSQDIRNQQNLIKIQNSIQALQDKKLKAQWYPPVADPSTDVSGEGAVNPGIIGSTLDFIGRPVRAVVGATKHFTGQGQGTLLEDMAQNIVRDKEYFGSVLNRAGAPKVVAVPLGFALDIALDPVNWATMGTAALVPRIASGFIKGGVEGGIAATRSGLLEKAVTIGKYTPFLAKDSVPFTALKNKAFTATSEYERLTGNTLENILQQRSGMGVGNYRVPLSTVVQKIAGAIPGGETALNTLWYDPVGWVRDAVNESVIRRAFGVEGVVDVAGAVKARVADSNADISSFLATARGDIERKVAEARVGAKDRPSFDLAGADDASINSMSKQEVDTIIASLPPGDIRSKLEQVSGSMVEKLDDVVTLNNSSATGRSGDALENGLRILNEQGFLGGNLTLSDIDQIVKSGALGETGVKWFDNFMQKIKDFRSKVDANGNRIGGIGQSTLKYYDGFMALFRGAKVGGSPVGHMNALVGNAIMNHLGIGDIGPEYWALYKKVFDMYHNVPDSAAKLQGMIQDAGVFAQMKRDIEYMDIAAKGSFGSKPAFLDAKEQAQMLAMNFRGEAAKQAGLAGVSAEQLAPYMDDVMSDLGDMRKAMPAPPDLSGTRTVRKMKAGESERAISTDIVSQEMFEKQVGRDIADHIAKKAKDHPGHLGWKAMDLVYNKMSNEYAKWDQISKMTTFLRSTMQGYTKAQMMRARNLIEIGADDFTPITHGVDGKALGETLYRLNSRKGLELSNALYMNYAAMPAAIRVLRNFPLLGSPFASFMYGMALKTGQTLAYNPSAFNKVTFALNEFGGTPTPLEKQALDSKFYSYLKQPGMYRIPFTDANPLYANLANMIPYYSMNMFNPSHASYDTSTLSSSFAHYVNASPLVKDPLGSILFSNLILPTILSEGIQPQGTFGQAIWPSDAGFFTKLGYTSRDLAEAVTPGALSITGLAGGLAAPGLTPYVPLYGYRNIANAVQGKNVYGITGKEPKSSRTIRGILARMAGIPIQAPVNLSYKNTKK